MHDSSNGITTDVIWREIENCKVKWIYKHKFFFVPLDANHVKVFYACEKTA